MRNGLLRFWAALIVVLGITSIAASQQGGGGNAGAGAAPVAAAPRGNAPSATAPRMTLTSPAFQDYAPLPLKYAPNAASMVTFDAPSPPLAWSNPPAGTVSYALTMTDMEGSSGGYPQDVLLWMVVNMPNNANSRLLAEGIQRGRTSMLPEGVFQRSFLTNGYIGPQPGANVSSHHYLFELFALNTMLDVPRDVTLEQLRTAMNGHQTGRVALIATCCVGSK